MCAPVEENLFKLSQAEIAERGLKYLPRDLSQAIDEFEKSELMHEILGDVICENLISAKRAEWEEYRAHVSSWKSIVIWQGCREARYAFQDNSCFVRPHYHARTCVRVILFYGRRRACAESAACAGAFLPVTVWASICS